MTAKNVPELTVVLITHNRADLIDATLISLSRQRWSGTWDIVIVDNDSDDGTPALLTRWANELPVPTTVVTATATHSPAYARNTGVANAEGTSVLMIDDDDLLAPGFVAAMGEALRTSVLVGPRHDHHELNAPTMARYRGSFQTTALGEVFGISVVSGGGVGCRRSLWLELDGQSEDLGYGGEDIDFALRAQLADVTPTFAPDAIYQVRLREGFAASFRQGRAFGAARVRLYCRHSELIGARPERTISVARRWAGLLSRLPDLFRSGPRDVWGWQLGRRLGHITGSLNERTWYP